MVFFQIVKFKNTLRPLGVKLYEGKNSNTTRICWLLYKILESSKSYICKIYVGNLGAYPRP
jgi:hypothetical protein